MMNRAFPWVLVGLGVIWVITSSMPPRQPDGEMRIHDFGKIPIVYNGRVKPADTFARNMLRTVSEKDTFTDAEGKRQPAIRWLLDMITQFRNPDAPATKHKVFRIVHHQVLHSLGLERRSRYRYSMAEFRDKFLEMRGDVKGAYERREKKQPLDEYDMQLLSLYRGFNAYYALAGLDAPHLVPPEAGGGKWETFMDAARRGGDETDARVQAWRDLLNAYAKKDVEKFNAAVAEQLEWYGINRPSDRTRTGLESYFNRLDPFMICKVLYVGGFILSCLAWFSWGGPLRRSSLHLLWFTFILHTAALILRIYLSGRPPVTNLYSSAVFIGWGCVVIGLVLEHIYKLGVGNTVAAASGFGSLLVAYALSADGDTMEVLQAVLDTQFWLATHVTCITLGYSTTYVAGLIGIMFLFRGVFTSTLTEDVRRNLARMIYGVVCFATFFSFVGTVLGGLWADDSWGRFWGWDPKENGALIIVLWNAIILHARWGGLVRERGLAMLAVFGNIVVTWSWFGVNQLSVGLHSYGFTEGTTLTIIIFMLSQAGIMVVGAIPGKFWLSNPSSQGVHAKDR